MTESLCPRLQCAGLDYQLRGSAPLIRLLSPEGEEFTSKAGRRELLGTYRTRAAALAAAEQYECAVCGDLHGGSHAESLSDF